MQSVKAGESKCNLCTTKNVSNNRKNYFVLLPCLVGRPKAVRLALSGRFASRVSLHYESFIFSAVTVVLHCKPRRKSIKEHIMMNYFCASGERENRCGNAAQISAVRRVFQASATPRKVKVVGAKSPRLAVI